MDKYAKLLNLLLESSPQTSKELSVKLELSIRTIKNYVAAINSYTPNTITSSHLGYEIDSKKAHSYLNSRNKNNKNPQNAKERELYIINKLLKNKTNEGINIYDMCDDIIISPSTLKNDLKYITKIFKKYNLNLVFENDNLYLKGIEQNKRKMISSLIYEESNVNFLNIESIQKLFPEININYIKHIIKDTLANHNHTMNDYSLLNLILHIALSIDRIKKNYNAKPRNLTIPNDITYSLTKDILDQLSESFNISFTNEELYEIMILIHSKSTISNFENIDESELETIIGKQNLELANYLAENIYELYNINLKDKDFFIRFALHIRNLIIRAENNLFNRNPLVEDMKASFPLIYDMSVTIAEMILNKTNLKINESEIAFIAFHIGSAIANNQGKEKKIKTIFFSPNYYNFDNQISNELKKIYKDKLEITDVGTHENDLNNLLAFDSVDLIITTVPIANQFNIPMLKINMFLTKKDLERIDKKIKVIKKDKEKKVFKRNLKNILSPHLFEINTNLKNEKECIDYMSDKLLTLGYTNSNFKSDVLKREELSSTAFGKLAIPHSISMNAKKTGMFVLISPKAINWYGKNVNLVIMMSFNKNDRDTFHDLYDKLATILTDNENISEITKCKTLDEFIDKLVEVE